MAGRPALHPFHRCCLRLELFVIAIIQGCGVGAYTAHAMAKQIIILPYLESGCYIVQYVVVSHNWRGLVSPGIADFTRVKRSAQLAGNSLSIQQHC